MLTNPIFRGDVSEHKLRFLGIVFAIVTVVTIPIIFPHIKHPSMIYHIILHVVSLAVSLFLSSIAVIAYMRDGKTRLFFMALGFITLAIVEVIMLLSATGNLENPIIPEVNVELPHIVLMGMILLFGLGVLKVK